MKYVYKIYSNYDGFTPARIPSRLEGTGTTLRLGWKRYVEVVEPGDEIWIYFHGRHRFDNGVYARGIAEEVLYDERVVLRRVTEYNTQEPLTAPGLSARIASVVSPRYQQVFVLPEELDAAPVCSVATTAASCEARACGSCPTWKSVPTLNRRILKTPHRLVGRVERFAPAYWVIPNRSFLYKSGKVIRRRVRRSSELGLSPVERTDLPYAAPASLSLSSSKSAGLR